VSLLEIGVQNGGSLEIWHKLLPLRSRVVGLDLDERCRELKFSEGIELYIGDATGEAFINGALGEAGFDIIIDDGSHRSKDVIASFELLFRRLKPGGLYIVEDLHASYWPAFGGGFRAEGSSIEWAKTLVDAINADHIKSTSKLRSDELARLRHSTRKLQGSPSTIPCSWCRNIFPPNSVRSLAS
jgi:SAM-dependent methyltransferase